MAKRLGLMVILFSVMFLLSGCWNSREMNNMVIAAGMGVDKVDQGYLVSIQVVDPGEISNKGSGRTPVTVYKGTGNTIFEAIRKLTSVAARKIYFSHLRMFLIGEETARSEGIGKIIEFLSRDHEVREDYYIVIAKKNTAENILRVLTPIEKIPANKMFTSLKTSSSSWAATGTVKIDDLISDLMTEGKAPAITGIEFKGNADMAGNKKIIEVTEPYARLKYGGMAVFRKDKLVGWMNENESKGYNYLNSKVKSTVETITCPKEDGEFSFELKQLSSRVQVRSRHGSPEVDIRINAEGGIGEVQCQVDLTDLGSIHEMEQLIGMKMEEEIRKTIKKAISLKSDFVGLGAAIHRSDPKAWNKLKENWPEQMGTIPITIKVDIKLRETGKTKGSFLEKIKE